MVKIFAGPVIPENIHPNPELKSMEGARILKTKFGTCEAKLEFPDMGGGGGGVTATDSLLRIICYH